MVVGAGVLVGSGVLLGVGVGPGVLVAIGVGVSVGGSGVGVGVELGAGVLVAVGSGVLVGVAVGPPDCTGRMEIAAAAQWSLAPRAVLMVIAGPAPARITPEPICLPDPATRFHCSLAGATVDNDVHVSQENAANTRSSAAESAVTAAVSLVALFPAKGPSGSVWSTPLKVLTPTTAYCDKAALKAIATL